MSVNNYNGGKVMRTSRRIKIGRVYRVPSTVRDLCGESIVDLIMVGLGGSLTHSLRRTNHGGVFRGLGPFLISAARF
jgi:hypothetical protein